MPTKETKSKVEKEEKKIAKKTVAKKASTTKKKTTTKKASEPKKVVTKKSTTTEKKATPKSSTPKKTTAAKKATTTKASTTKKTTATKKATTTKATTPKKTTTKKSTTSSTTKKASTTKKVSKTTKKTTTTRKKSTKKSELDINKEKTIKILEYYDLPYRYNETIVKILAQTPNILFVYWDISDNDRTNYVLDHGQYFFDETYPILLVHNITKNYTIEVPINDFANSWYLELEDANCEYNIELGRRYKEYAFNNPEIKIPNDNYIYVKNSNDLTMPNDHVLFDTVKSEIQYRNVKNGTEFNKTISDILVSDTLQHLKDLYELYKNIYQVDQMDPFFFDLNNPGSGNPTSTFK